MSIAEIGSRVYVFQNLMHRSAVPPPEASRPCWCGDQPIALTAAECSLNLARCWVLDGLQTISLLSLPPLASWLSSKLHLSPQPSYLWPTSFEM